MLWGLVVPYYYFTGTVFSRLGMKAGYRMKVNRFKNGLRQERPPDIKGGLSYGFQKTVLSSVVGNRKFIIYGMIFIVPG